MTQRRSPVLALGTALALVGCGGGEQPVGEIRGSARPTASVAAARDAQQAAAAKLQRGDKQILFGDLHVHTTYSLDAFLFSLPILGGEGAHPPADACDFARHCSALDFLSITDHARNLTPAHWAEEKESVRQCDAVADPADPDLVVFHGWEWTQLALSAEDHYGHKNVIFRGLAEDEVPARPITALGGATHNDIVPRARGAPRGRFADPLNWRAYADLQWLVGELDGLDDCPAGVDTRELPPDCRENAPTPSALFEKLDQWGFDSIVIPHGNAWGSYSPPGTAWDKQLAQHDSSRQTLIEVASGHGNSEVYRSFRAFETDADGERVCPEPTSDYLPCCWRAGEIMRERCGDLPASECEARVAEAQRLALDANAAPDLVFPGTTAEDWLDCGQCRDCFKPAYGYRPRGSTQYALALSEPTADGEPRRFRFGFVSSSDSHSARSGSGYKQGQKRGKTDMFGPRSDFYGELFAEALGVGDGDVDPRRPQPASELAASPLTAERISSFFYPGGLVAVHAGGRGRDAIWGALERREVYGTSGPRLLLWFDLVNGPDGSLPMGSEVALDVPPRFEVRAAGAFAQKPGCPEDAVRGLSRERVDALCLGECYHPGDTRQRIDAIEVVRIRPRAHPDERVENLIDDPWRRLECPPDPAGCRVTFEDPDFPTSAHDAVYYVRALQEPTPAINANNLRTTFDADGNPTAIDPCFADYREEPGDTCLAPIQERAWSSPIYIDHP